MSTPNILQYDWNHAGFPSETAVDLDYANNVEQRQDLSIFLRVRITPKKEHKGDCLNSFEEVMLTMLQNQIQRVAQRTKCLVPAVRRFGCVLELFVYCPDDDAADKIAGTAVRAKWAAVEFDQRHDSAWTVYLQELYPTPAQLQTVKNEETIHMMLQYDDNLHSPRRINHYCTFCDEVSRIGFAEEVRKSGFALGDPYFAPESDLPHGVVVRNLGAIEKSVVDEWTTKIIAIVEKYNGRYCGWDAQMRRKRTAKDKIG